MGLIRGQTMLGMISMLGIDRTKDGGFEWMALMAMIFCYEFDTNEFFQFWSLLRAVD